MTDIIDWRMIKKRTGHHCRHVRLRDQRERIQEHFLGLAVLEGILVCLGTEIVREVPATQILAIEPCKNSFIRREGVLRLQS